ncbi:hypothetical protein [Enterobacter ludwigii]|uniref:hypothetical protein n=1 Tax=Enterobacter ludwigii TaxID=299767 RepID=UPI003974F5E5
MLLPDQYLKYVSEGGPPTGGTSGPSECDRPPDIVVESGNIVTSGPGGDNLSLMNEDTITGEEGGFGNAK